MKSRPPIQRMMIISRKLGRGERFNLRTLSQQLEVSQKALQRDIDFMRDRLGYEMVYVSYGPGIAGTFVGRPPEERVL